VDFPLANGLGNANLADVTGLLFETEEGGVVAGYNYGISSIRLLSPGTPPGDITCPPTTSPTPCVSSFIPWTKTSPSWT